MIYFVYSCVYTYTHTAYTGRHTRLLHMFDDKSEGTGY